MIVKVQVSLATNAATPQCLVYDEERDFVYHGDLPDAVAQLMRGRDKAYFEAMVGDDGGFVLVLEAEEQDW